MKTLFFVLSGLFAILAISLAIVYICAQPPLSPLAQFSGSPLGGLTILGSFSLFVVTFILAIICDLSKNNDGG